MNEKSPVLSTPGGWRAKGSDCPRTVSSASTARTMAARQMSVRDSAHEFHMPAAQFSVSKYQLMPQTGAVAAMTAARGRPSLQGLVQRGSKRIARRAHAHGVSQAPAQPRRGQTLQPARRCRVVLRGIPAPHRALDPSRRPAPEQVERIDHQQRDEGGHHHVAGDGDRPGRAARAACDRAHAADVNRKERRDKREDPSAIDRRARLLGGLDLRRHRDDPRAV